MIVVSDLVGTLTTGSPTLGLVSWVRHNQSALRANVFLARILPRYVLARLGLVDMRNFGEWTLIAALPLVRNPTEEIVREMAIWSVDQELWPRRRPDVLERLARHKQRGAHLYLASSAFEPAVEAFGERIGASAIGSPIEIADGRLRFASELIKGRHKGEEVFKRLQVDRVDTAYGDTWADILILERADHPVAVYPDERLRAAAVKHGWEILEHPDAQ